MASIIRGGKVGWAPAFSLNVNKTFALLFSLSCAALILGFIFYSGSSTSASPRNLCSRGITPYKASDTQLENLQKIMELAIDGIPIINILGASVFAFRNGKTLDSPSYQLSPSEASIEEEDVEVVEIKDPDEEIDFFLDFPESFPSQTIEEVFKTPPKEVENVVHFLQAHGDKIDYFESGQYLLNIEKCFEREYPKSLHEKCVKRQIPSGWQRLGTGNSKDVWTHKALPGHVIKFFGRKEFHDVSEELEKIKLVEKSILANNFQHLEVPSTLLIKRLDKYFLIQQLVESKSYEDSISEANTLAFPKAAPPLTRQAVQEFVQLFQELKLCDVSLGIIGRAQNKNIGWKEKTIEKDGKIIKTPIVRFFDLNCPFKFSHEEWKMYHKNFIREHYCFLEGTSIYTSRDCGQDFFKSEEHTTTGQKLGF